MMGEFNFRNESVQEIKSLFEKQTERNPNSIAIKYQSKEITYNELNQRANQLAHKLLSIKNIKSNKLIPILLDRNENMMIGLLGVLKAGAAYVPIDSNLPDERIKYILAEINSDILITLDKYLHRVSSIESSLNLISIDLETSLLNKDSNPEIIIEDDSLAYVIFTSGTTGTPKGVMVEHKSVINLISLNLPIVNLASQSKKFNCLFFSNYSFDAHVWEVFSCLLNGHTLCIPENFIRYDIRALKKYIEDNHINIALIPPALLDPDILLNVDLLVVGGEKISQSVLQSYLNAKINVLNAYGPTEATVISSYHLFRETSEYNNIGLPINNTHYYVLDKHLELAKNEEIGELYIGGLGLARGYVQKTALHKSSFIEHPSLGRLYKTGDLIRVTVDGAYEYIGRSDRQVKIRSHRIELGEIESVIHLFPGINHCIVITDSILEKTNHPSSLILAYFVSDIEIDQQQLKLFVQNQLPHYMLPNQFIRLEKFPLTLNGKIDISVLPMLHSIKEDKETPRNEFDIGILNIWSQVLGINSNLIGISDDFFYLGGNSILAIKLVKELNEQLNLNINVVELFELSNIKNISDKSQFKSNLLCNKHFDSHQISPSERLILRDYFSTEYKNIYNENFVIEINHEIDKINYEKAIAYLFDEFDILHTNYLNSDGFFSRLENTQVPPVFEFIDLSQDKAAEKTYLNFINNAVIQPFHIEKDKLIRFYLFKFSQSQFKLFIVLFHAILDGTSVINILLPKLYLYLTKEIEPSKFLLSDYHSFSNKIQQVYEDNQQTKLSYWARRFSEAEPWNYIPSHSHQDISTGRQIKFLINEHITQSLNYLTHRFSTSLFDILSGCFVLVLNKFSQQNNLTIRTNIDERLYAPEFIDTPGCFINNLFLSVNLKSTWTLEDLIIAIKESKKESMANLVDYDTLLSNFREKIIDLSRVHFNIEPEPYVQPDYYQSQVQTHSGEIKNDLYFELDIKTDHILGRVEYKSSIFKQKEIDTLISSFQNLLLNIDELIQTKIININLLSDLQLNTILNEFNRNYISYSNVKTLVKTFESQAQRNPDGIAISHGELKYTYQELNQKSNQFAHYLRSQYQIKPNDLVCLCVDKNELMLIAILAVLKVGAAYVPMEPSYPEHRIEHILEDTKSMLLITNEQHVPRLHEVKRSHDVSFVCIDNLIASPVLINYPEENLGIAIPESNLAYVIYTSGTTGKPKGVLQTHGNVARLLLATEDLYGFHSGDVWTLFHAYVFDFSVWEIWGALAYGGKLIIPSYDQTRDFAEFHALCEREGVTVLNQTPSAFYQFMDFATEQKLEHLRYVIFGGEALHLPRLSHWFSCYGEDKPQLINMYGITETTVHVTYHRIKQDKLDERSQIGTVLPNLKAYVLDDALNPVPVYAIGELYVGGSSLACGYLNQEALTSERFIPSPFDEGRLYKTGDLVRWLPDGSLEYVGRNDFQVKIRGHRIELGEIESVLLSYPGMKQAVVLAKKQQSTEGYYLVGYCVSDVYDELALVNYLSHRLPDYMVPQVFVPLEKLPLTVNGKLDHQQLPEPVQKSSNVYVAPRSDLERQVCEIWAEVLGIPLDRLSIRDDFFRLGGDSIVSIQLSSRMRQRLGLVVSVRSIFNYRSIERLFDEELPKQQAEVPPLKSEQGVLEGDVPLLPIQRWFMAQPLANPNHYNQAFMIRVPVLDRARLQESINQLIAYHDNFRLLFAEKEKGRYQAQTNYPFHCLDVSLLDVTALQAQLTQWQSQFDIQQGPLFTVAYLYGYPDGSARIYFAVHHLIIDAVSWRILADDLCRLYQGERLGNKGSSYRQWVAALEGYGCKNQEEKEYWNGVMSDYIPINASLKTTVSHSVDLSFTKLLTSRLLHESGKAYNTQINDILLTALGLSLSELTGHWVHHVVLEGHGREEINAEIDVSRTLGWFTTLFPVRIEVCQDLAQSLKRVKDAQRQIPQHGVGYGALFGYEQNPLPEISFNYLGQLDKGSVNDWDLCSDAVGETNDPLNRDTYLFNLNGWVSEGHLQFNIVSRLPEAALSVVTDKFTFYLKALVEHTASQSRTYLTCSDVEQVVAQDYLDRLQEHQELEAVYKASSLQQGFIYHALTQGDTDEAYRVQISWHYKAAIDKSKLKEAWHYAQRKYPALRLRFAWEEQVLQVVDKESRLHWNYIECADEAEIQDLKVRDRLSTYDLSESGLFRVTLIKQHASHYTCIFNNHHAILDGWGVAVLLDYVHETYKRLCADEVIESSEDVSYLETQKYIQTTGSDKFYWEGYLSQLDERVCLDGLVKPGLRDVVVSEYKYIHKTQEQQLVLAQSLKIDLILLSQERGVTLNAILQYAWHKVLSVYGYSRQTTVGTVISGRNLPIDNLEQSAGLYINTIPLIVNHDERKVIDIIQQIQEDINEANSHSKVNLAELQSSGERLFDTLFVYENYPVSQNDNELNIIFDQTTTKLDYPLALICENDIRLRYASELFDEQVISKLLDGLVTILTQLVKNTEIKANNIWSISESSYKNIILEKNKTDFNILGAKTLHELFEKQAKETPYGIALEFNNRKYTYSEINAISNKIAFVLQNEFSIKRGDIVGLFLERSEFTFIAILSVLKSGAAYLPIDINFPEQRVSYILEDAQVSLVLTSNKQKNQLENITKQIPRNILNYLAENELCVNNTDFESYVDNISCCTEPTDLAYVIYTSGTTGQPKGVMIEHRSIVSRLLWLKNTHKLEQNFIFGAKTSYVFDPSIREMFLPLISGAGIYIFSDEETKDVERIIELCITKNINGLLFVPSQLVIFIEALKQCSDEVINQMPLKLIYSCGEALSANVVNELFECLPSLVVKNQYGPTEGCQFLFEKNIDNLGFLKIRTVSVGSLVGNMRAYVLDSNMVPLPELAIGELYISGDGLTRGYLNNDQLSNEKLLDNPFRASEEIKESKNKKIYKTGDLVRWLPDGNLEYIGRNDFQIKIRGHRIDLGEIESVFLDYPGIKQVVVIAEKNKEGSTSNLIAYYVSNMEFAISLIYEFLRKKLPDYMLPKAIVHLTKMPMTINGKLNRAALPQYSLDHQLSDYIAPTTSIEKDLCEIYSEILDIEHIGISSNFFHLGGNSILSFKLVNRLRKILSQEVNIKHIYMCPTISDLLAFFESNEEYSEEGLEVEF